MIRPREHFDTIQLSSDHTIYCEFGELSEEYLKVDGSTFCRTVEQHPRLMRLLEIRGADLYNIKIMTNETQHFSGEHGPALVKARNDPEYRFLSPVDPRYDEINGLPEGKSEIRIKAPIQWTAGSQLGESAFNACDAASDAFQAGLMALTHELGHHIINIKGRPEVQKHLQTYIIGLPGKHVSRYATTSGSEHFCEALAVFTLMPDALKLFDPNMHIAIEEILTVLEKTPTG